MTTQIPDSIYYKKASYPIYSEPLESVLKNSELKSKLTILNTACWRGYIASWSVTDNKLYLVEWTGYLKGGDEANISDLFSGQATVFADWFTGSIVLHIGNVIAYDYIPKYDGTLTLEFERGIIISESQNWPTAKEIMKAIKKQEELDNMMPF